MKFEFEVVRFNAVDVITASNCGENDNMGTVICDYND